MNANRGFCFRHCNGYSLGRVSRDAVKSSEEAAKGEALPGYDHKIHNDATNEGRRHKEKKDESKQSRYRQLLER